MDKAAHALITFASQYTGNGFACATLIEVDR
jgi:hypothetical protein